MTVQGIVCNLERFATHDGPGIRTTVYLKGCPLGCVWCSSPHTQKLAPEILYHENLCQRNGACEMACPQQAIRLTADGSVEIDRSRCDACGVCIYQCSNRALEITGEPMTVDELFKAVDKDSAFYRRSNGGVTVSGGELTMQYRFVSAFLEKCRKNYIHTAIESCGFSKWPPLASVLQHVDLAYFDIKHMDERRHTELTGASNRLILENIEKAAEMCALIIRVPVIPGCNDSDENIAATGRFAAGLGPGFQHIELLPYHQLGTNRYAQLGKDYALEGVQSPDIEHVERLKTLVMAEGISAEIVA